MPKPQLAIFDFCGTLIRFQTADRYVNFCVERLKGNKIVQCRHRLVQMMDKFRIFKIYNRIKPSNNFRKRVILWQLKGLSYRLCNQMAKQYFETELLPAVVSPLIDKLQEHLAQNDRVIILSGGYDIYIHYFAAYFGVEETVSSKIAFKNNVCLGKMDGEDCMKYNKVRAIQSLMTGVTSYCYTDSISDLPLLEIVDNPIVVSKQTPQKWASQRNYKQIIWN